jgi:hypothetical protein
MRVNIYSQELTPEVGLVWKISDNGIKHYGVRFMLASSPLLHHAPDDDDRSAVTFWLPNCGSMGLADAQGLFLNAAKMVADAGRSMRLDAERRRFDVAKQQMVLVGREVTEPTYPGKAFGPAEDNKASPLHDYA